MNPFALFDRINEKPLDNLVLDGGFSRILRTIACIGDSLSSGEFETVDQDNIVHYHDIYTHSWGQYLARIIGARVYNFSKGGMTASAYCQSFADENDFWNPKFASNAYIIALGVNDLLNEGQPIGGIDDIDFSDWHRNKPTFAGYYGQIIQRYQELHPDSKFFLMTMPQETRSKAHEHIKKQHAALLYQISKCFPNSYVLDFNRYAPVYDQHFRDLFYLREHMNPCGYLLTAQLVVSYLDYIIRHNMNDFTSIGLMEMQ